MNSETAENTSLTATATATDCAIRVLIIRQEFGPRPQAEPVRAYEPDCKGHRVPKLLLGYVEPDLHDDPHQSLVTKLPAT
jgi:hypothetical protein